MLQTEWMPERTRAVFDWLAQEKSMSPFILIGGTAMALRHGHRLSEDLDFWLPEKELHRRSLSDMLFSMRAEGHAVRLSTPENLIASSRINGVDILDRAQDYTINGVKVTFFSRFDHAYQHFVQFVPPRESGQSFRVMSDEGIFSMKSYVITQRTKSRDLYDILFFMKNGKTVQDILNQVDATNIESSFEMVKSILCGDIPIDKGDEGFESIGITCTVGDVYRELREYVDQYEQSIARKMISSVTVCENKDAHPKPREMGD